MEEKYLQMKDSLKNKVDQISEYFQVSNAVEQEISDVDQELKSTIGIVASVAHATELARRQLVMRLGDPQKLMEEFKSYTQATKKSILAISTSDLSSYVTNVRVYATQVLSSVLSLLSAYVPVEGLESLPTAESIRNNLTKWKISIDERLAALKKEKEGGSEK